MTASDPHVPIKGPVAVYRAVLELIAPERRPAFFALVVCIIVMAGFDLIGVAAILPFLSVLSDPASVTQGWVGRLYDVTGFADSEDFLIAFGAAVFALILISVVIRALVYYLTTRFIRATTQQLAMDLLARYLSRPYEYYLGKNSAEIGKTLLAEALYVVNHAIAPAIRLIANLAVMAALLLLLIAIEPVGVLVGAGLLGAALALIYGGLGPVLERAGDRRLQASEDRFRITNEAMGGIKEIKLRGLERAVLERFRGPSDRIASNQAKISLYSNVPHYLIEGLCFGGMIAFVLYLLMHGGGGIDAALPVIGLFAFAGIKLIPVAKEVYTDASLLRANTPVLANLRADLAGGAALPASDDSASIGLACAIRLENIAYTYPGAARPLFDGLTLEIAAGSAVGIAGPTGSGKTTLVDLILGLLRPNAGQISVDGVQITEDNRRAWQRSIGYVPQSVYLSDSSIAANIAFGTAAGAIDGAAVERAARAAALHDFVMTLPEGYETIIGEGGVRLSGGQRQRIGIARALYGDPQLLVLDEATSALDTLTERAVVEAIERLGGAKTLIIIAHRLSTVEQCDRILVMKDGQIEAAGTFDELARDSVTFGDLVNAG
jgi:ABC-type multidrug transport system fused ATPase/permease subunit